MTRRKKKSSQGSTISTSKFTAHATVLLKHHYRNTPFHHYDDAVSSLLDDVNMEWYELLKGLIHKTYPRCDIFKMHRVNAPVMYGMYLLHKEEIRLANGGYDVKEKVLYHVTSESNAVESLKSGLDWRRAQRSRFGSGVSFSNNVDYCNYYANKSTNEVGVRVIIVSTVLVNDTHLIKKRNKDNTLIIPPGTADTTVSPNGHVFVKYYDFESYPLFFVYYRWTPEILNESTFYISKTNYTLQRIKREEQTMCEQVADLHIAEFLSLSLRRQSANKQRRAAAKAESEAAAAKAESEAAAPKAVAAESTSLPLRSQRANKKRVPKQQRPAAAKAKVESEAAAPKAVAAESTSLPLRSQRANKKRVLKQQRRAAAKAKAEAEAAAAPLSQRQRRKACKKRRQRQCRTAAKVEPETAEAKAEAEAEAKEEVEAEAASLLKRQRRYDSKHRRQRLRRAAAEAETEAEAADLLRRQRRYDSKQRRQRLSRAAAKAEAIL